MGTALSEGFCTKHTTSALGTSASPTISIDKTVEKKVSVFLSLSPPIPIPLETPVKSNPSTTMSTAELACSYAALILADDGVEITAEKIQTLIGAAKVPEVEPIWTSLFAKALEGKDVKDLLTNVGSGGGAPAAAVGGAAAGGAAPAAEAAAEEKEEEKEESDEDMGFGLFD
ncbi:hypothetical protein CNMCM5793_002839 [Aspergillus hiratsukae]|uniref:Large ribosomal subunit protein P1 n=1 Tax=Aspergillus hiratsukae TaxID=1194566 RepID=A0A8H6UUI0_9EURO|nr:hypothetical protein CNMCM5793_002839 [Aspergillus hiratsukae]KAF7167473.1 hypothetical protein CNMCM6106_003033 [Aspergillus hiratsukae]